MKKFDLVKLKNTKPYKNLNLYKDSNGIILEEQKGKSKVLFFNPLNRGECLITQVNNFDISYQNAAFPSNLHEEFINYFSSIEKRAVSKFSIPKVKEFDWVKLNVEKPKYAKEGIHKGEIGCVMSDHAFQNCVEVDFINFDDSMAVDMDDLEVIKRREDK